MTNDDKLYLTLKQLIIKTQIELRNDIYLNTLISETGIDSINFLELVFKIEKEFDIEIEDEELDNLRKIGDIIDLIKLKTAC